MPYMGDISMCKDKHKTDHVFFWPFFGLFFGVKARNYWIFFTLKTSVRSVHRSFNYLFRFILSTVSVSCCLLLNRARFRALQGDICFARCSGGMKRKKSISFQLFCSDTRSYLTISMVTFPSLINRIPSAVRSV